MTIAYKTETNLCVGEILYMTGKDYYDQTKDWAYGSNRCEPNEPYNYFDEINDAMRSLGYDELMESVWEIPGTGLEALLRQLAEHGFAMVRVD